MSVDSIELSRIRSILEDIEQKTEKLTIVNSTASFDQTVSITGNLYVNGELIDVSVFDITSALGPYLTIANASAQYSTPAQITSSYPTRIEVTGNINNITSSLSSSYARLAASNIFSANQTITGTLNASSNISGNANLIIGGNVGIGRTPSIKLDVEGTIISRRNDSSTEGGELQLARAIDNTAKWYIDTQGSGDLSNLRIFDNSSSVAFFIESQTRDVGIGTTSPTEKLEVNGAIKIPLASNSDNNSPGLLYASDDDFLYDGLYLNHYGMGFHSPVNTVGAGAYISGYYGIDLFTAGTNRLSILLNGNIGIGNDTPSEKLHVVGNAIFGNTFNTANGYPISDVILHAGDATASLGQIDALSIFRQQSADSWPQIATMAIGRYELASTNPRTRLDFNLKHTADGTDTAEVTVMTLNSNGRMGIGETNPSSPLHVVGNGNTVRLQGTDHTYIEWYPDGATTRKAYTGFPASAADYYIIANEIATNGHIVFQPGTSARVGINIISPSAQFHVSSSISEVARFESNSTLNDAFIRVRESSTEDVVLGSTSGVGFVGSSTNTSFAFRNNNTNRAYVNSNGLVPWGTNTYSCGTSGEVWSAVWVQGAVLNGSDERIKKDIQNSDLGLEFINNLRPVKYKFKNRQNVISFDENGNETITPTEGVRYHYGLIAQEVKSILGDKDFAGYVYDDKTDSHWLRYEEFISPIIKSIQVLSEENKLLKNKLEEKDALINDILTRLMNLENK